MDVAHLVFVRIQRLPIVAFRPGMPVLSVRNLKPLNPDAPVTSANHQRFPATVQLEPEVGIG
jgi:hypothetical protein